MWKDVVGYEDYFMVSTNGEIFSKRTNKILKQTKQKSGYMVFSSKIGGRKGKCICLRIHRCVAFAFLENLENKPEVNHKDGNKLNNKVDNLEWVSGSENVKHAYDIGLSSPKRGILNKGSKLTQEDLDFIRKNSKKFGGTYGARELARKFGMNHSNIGRILNGTKYK